MAYEFQKLSEVEVLTEVPEGASVLAEVNGDIKRVPGDGLGGNSGKTLIITATVEEALPSLTESGSSSPLITANMTLNEAGQSLYDHELTGVYGYLNNDGVVSMVMLNIEDASNIFNMACLVIYNSDIAFFWTEDGISTEEPSSGGK